MTVVPEITGREPHLIQTESSKGKQRLSIRRLRSMLSTIAPDSVSLEAAVQMLQSDDFYVRFSAAELLGKRADRETRVALQELLNSADTPIRASIARHLYYFSWFVAEPLFQIAFNDPDPRVHESAIYALCNLRDLNAFQLLKEKLPHEPDDVKVAAAWGLNDCKDPAAVPVLEIVLRADDPDVRVKALESMGVTNASTAVPYVRQSLQNDPIPAVIYAASLSLIELIGEASLAELAAAITENEGEHRHQLVQGLFHATSYRHIDINATPAAKEVINALALALQDSDPQIRLAAVYPLAWMGGDRPMSLANQAVETEPDTTLRNQMSHIIASFSPARHS
jgi:HEAT repeat protein